MGKWLSLSCSMKSGVTNAIEKCKQKVTKLLLLTRRPDILLLVWFRRGSQLKTKTKHSLVRAVRKMCQNRYNLVEMLLHSFVIQLTPSRGKNIPSPGFVFNFVLAPTVLCHIWMCSRWVLLPCVDMFTKSINCLMMCLGRSGNVMLR